MPSARRTAGEIMDRTAALMNDSSLTDYTYPVMMPFLNMAISEMNEHLEESNHPMTNQVFPWGIKISVGINAIVNPPLDMVEIQEVGERVFKNGDVITPFKQLPRRDFTEVHDRTNSLVFWCWKDGQIKFNELGPSVDMEVQVRYIRKALQEVFNPDQEIGMINCIPYLSFKTAALCALFIGENSTRAQVLNDQAEQALERIIAISNKGRQQMMTRHRPFRAGWKMRGY